MKPRRDITLGEMQDECRLNDRICRETETKAACKYLQVCKCCTPKNWNLIDLPRFNEAQMAFWRGLYEIGVNFVMLADDGLLLRMATSRNADNCSAIMVIIGIQIGLEKGEELDLAELFGKERK